MATDTTTAWVARNPATGAELGRVETTTPGDVAGIVARARKAQHAWAETPWRRRHELLCRWWTILARDAEDLVAGVVAEVGKPKGEAMAEAVSALDAVRWTVKHAGRVLADERIGPGWQRWLLLGPVRLRWRPIGVIGMIGTWNYPLLLNIPTIAQALAAGCTIVWKPSEWAALSGLRVQRTLEEAGVPEDLVAAVHGGPEVGEALVASDLDKGVFTGGIANGRRVLASLASRGIPAVAELSGFDAAIVLPDAPLESTVRGLTWGACVGAGQTCVAVKRIYIIGDPTGWADALAAQANALRVGDPAVDATDVGPMISEAARARFDRTIRSAIAAGARILAGGEPVAGPGWFYRPTVLQSDDPEAEAALAGVFGPVILVRGVPDVVAAIAAANASPFGLAASVWGRDRRAARAVAERLQAGMIAINDAIAPSAHAAAPFGGVKASGFGRTRGRLGLMEFVQPQTISSRAPGGLRPQLFPYSRRMPRLLRLYRWLFHGRS